MERKEILHNIPIAANHAVLNPQEFITDVAKEALHAKARFSAHTMQLDNDEFSAQLFAIYGSLGDEVEKKLYVDDFSLLVIGQEMVEANRLLPWERRKIEKKLKDKQEMLDTFRCAGVDVIITNPATKYMEKLIPTSGRSHLKGVFIDDTTAYIGGLNFDDDTASRAEVMVKFCGEEAEKVSGVFGDIESGKLADDTVAPISDDTFLLYDAGKPGTSIIIEEALKIIDSAKETIRLTSYFFPDGRVAKALKRAQERKIKGKIVSVDIVYSPPELGTLLPANMDSLVWAADKVSRLQARLNGAHNLNVHNNQFRPVHAKILIADRGIEGSEVALFGTNNLSDRGIKSGTREVQIMTRNPKLIASLSTKYHDFENETKENQIAQVV